MSNRTVNRKGCQLYLSSYGDNELEVVELTTGTVLGEGDIVNLTGATSTDARYPKVARAAANDSDGMYGIFVKLLETTHSDVTGYYDGVAANYGQIIRFEQGKTYVMQEDGDSSTLSTADIGKVVDIVVADADSTTGKSNMRIDSDSAATSAAKQFVLVGLIHEIDEVTGDAYSAWKVRPLEIQTDEAFQGISS